MCRHSFKSSDCNCVRLRRWASPASVMSVCRRMWVIRLRVAGDIAANCANPASVRSVMVTVRTYGKPRSRLSSFPISAAGISNFVRRSAPICRKLLLVRRSAFLDAGSRRLAVSRFRSSGSPSSPERSARGDGTGSAGASHRPDIGADTVTFTMRLPMLVSCLRSLGECPATHSVSQCKFLDSNPGSNLIIYNNI